MSMPSGRSKNVIEAVKAGFKGRKVWPIATTDPEAHYQQLAVTFGYVAGGPAGFLLTDLGDREIQLEQVSPGQ
jgi:hypothetical protein